MGKFTQRSAQFAQLVVQEIEQIPAKAIEISENILCVTTTPIEHVIKYVDRDVEVIREVPVYIEKEVIKYVDRVETKFVDVVKEIEKIVHVPVDKIQEVEKQVVSTIHKVPYWCWMALAMETLIICLLIIKK